MRFLLLLLLMPLLEIWLFIRVGSYLGAGPTVALVVLTTVAGVAVLRRVGLNTLARANQRIRAGEVPAQEMGEGLVLVIAGLLLILPGFATDAIDRKSTRLNSSHVATSYAVFCLKKKQTFMYPNDDY